MKARLVGVTTVEKRKQSQLFKLTKDGKVKRMYAMRIEDFSAESLQYIFVNHISREAKLITINRGRSIAKAYDIKQIEIK